MRDYGRQMLGDLEITDSSKFKTDKIYSQDGTTIDINTSDLDKGTSRNWIYCSHKSSYTLNQFITDIGSTDRTLVIDREISISEDLTIPENIELKFSREGIITGTDTLTINGSIDAGLYQIFGDDLDVDGDPKIESVYPEWFGAKGDGTTDDTSSIQKCININFPILFLNYYNISGLLEFSSSADNPKKLNWSGNNKGIIYFSEGGSLSLFKSDQSPCSINNIEFISDLNINSSVFFNVACGKISECKFSNFYNALKFSSAYITITNSVFKNNTIAICNIDIDGYYCNSNTISNNTIVDNVTGIMLSDTIHDNGFENFFSNNIYIENNTFENNTSNSISITNFNNVVINKNWFEAALAPIQNILCTDCKQILISNNWSQYTSSYFVKLDNSSAYIGSFRGSKFNICNSSKLYFTTPISEQDIDITQDESSSYFRENLRVNGDNIFYDAERLGITITPEFQNHGTYINSSNMNITWEYTGVPTGYISGCSKSGVIGEYSPMTSGNTLGAFMFAGSADTKLIIPAQISATSSETYTDTSTPSTIQFWTTSSGNTNICRRIEIQPEGHLYPYSDGVYSLGGPINKWSTIYSTTGTINTSDARDKTEISEIESIEKEIAIILKSIIKKFKFKNYVEKNDNAKIHIGIIAQEVIEVFKSKNLDAMDYGIICYDEWEETINEDTGEIIKKGNKYGIRYEELAMFILSAI